MKTRSASNSNGKKKQLPIQIILGILVVAAVIVAILVTGPTDDTVNPVPPTATPVPTLSTLSTAVPTPAVHGQRSQTDGVIIGAASVMFILLAGTAIVIYPSLKAKLPLEKGK